MRSKTARTLGWVLLGSTVLAALGLVAYATSLGALIMRTGTPRWFTPPAFWTIQVLFLVFSAAAGTLLVVMGSVAARIVGIVGVAVALASLTLLAWRAGVETTAFALSWGFVGAYLLGIVSPFVEGLLMVVAAGTATRLLRGPWPAGP